ncbi:MAG TPA: NAD-dependent epimerase/dehydratase family protein [Burkholderiales bacterium]|nr:NAD-dependent epimerase/dehydratase family protein [Burkholderiales bacterium]
MSILVTGAAGYIGSALVRALPAPQLIATDQSPPAALIGNLAYPRFARSLITPEVDTVFHLASLVSGGAEQNFELGTKVNLEATRDLLEACRLAGHCPTFVFASSIAVYGGELPDPVTDATPASPRLTYGAHKLVCEILIADYSRRGYVDGRALRLPAVLVRPGGANTAVSGWASALVREPLAGRDYVCPVRPETRMACISVGKVVEAFLHAARLPAERLGAERTVLLTGIGASAAELWAAVKPRARAAVSFAPDTALQALMDRVPRATRSERAAALGFSHNRNLEEIVREYEAAALAHHG